MGDAARAEVWTVDTHKLRMRTSKGTSHVSLCEISATGDLLATSAWDGTTKIWEMDSSKLLLTLERGVQLANSRDDQILGCRHTADGLEFVRLDRGTMFRLAEGMSVDGELVGATAFSHDGQQLIAYLSAPAQTSGRIVVWETGSLRQLGSVDTGQIGDLSCASDDHTLQVVHAGGASILPARSEPDGTLVYRPAKTYDVVSAPARASASFRRFAFLRDRKLTVRDLDQAAVQDPASADAASEQVYDLPNRHDDVLISADGKWAATGGWHSPVTCVWDLVHRRLAEQLRLGPQTGFYFSPESSQLVTSRWDAYRFWELETMRNTLTLRRIDCPQPDSMAVSADGRYAALILRPGELDIVSLPSGTVLFRLRRPTPGRPLRLAFSPDTSLLLECGSSPEYLVGVWDLAAVNRQLAEFDLGVPELPFPAGHLEGGQRASAVRFEGLEEWQSSGFIGLMDESAREKNWTVCVRCMIVNQIRPILPMSLPGTC